MVNNLYLLDQLAQVLLARANIPFDNPDTITVLFPQPLPVFGRAGSRKVVEDDDPFSVARIMSGQVRADEAGTTGDQIAFPHRSLSPCSPKADGSASSLVDAQPHAAYRPAGSARIGPRLGRSRRQGKNRAAAARNAPLPLLPIVVALEGTAFRPEPVVSVKREMTICGTGATPPGSRIAPRSGGTPDQRVRGKGVRLC